MRNYANGILFLVLIIVSTSCKSSGDETQHNTADKKQETRVPAKTKMDAGQFFMAALEGNLQVIKDGLSSGITVDETDEDMHTALMLASYNGHTGLVNYLIEAGADVNLTEGQQRTALMFASSGPFNETVIALLKAGADPNIADSVEHFTALMFAAAEGQSEVVTTLLKHGADKSMKDIDGDRAYEFALNNGHTAVVALLK